LAEHRAHLRRNGNAAEWAATCARKQVAPDQESTMGDDDDRAEGDQKTGDGLHAIAELIAGRWQCSVRPFGALAAIDWYAERHGRLVGVLELKSSSHAFGAEPSVFLDVRKWLALTLAAHGLGVPAIFVVRFAAGATCWTPLRRIDATRCRIIKSDNDIEPVIDVPLTVLKLLGD
jgi:hypothetical protein